MTDSQWTETRLQTLLGSEESIRLEFKSGRLLEQPPEKISDDLSKTVSAFANTEGGLLIVGISEEKRGKLRTASEVDGVAGTEWPTQRLQQILESNVHPPLIGIRVYTVLLSTFPDKRVAFVIDVPQSKTAHQARDYRYYGRSELETKPLRDFDIRFRIERGKSPSATIAVSVRLHRLVSVLCENKIAEFRRNLQYLKSAIDEGAIEPTSIEGEWASSLGADTPHLIDTGRLSAGYPCNEYEVNFILQNSGERTIRDFEVQIVANAASGCGVTDNENAQYSFGFGSQADISPFSKCEFRESLSTLSAQKVWPGANVCVGRLFVLVPATIEPLSGTANATWTVFLDDVLPISGEIDLSAQIAAAMDREN